MNQRFILIADWYNDKTPYNSQENLLILPLQILYQSMYKTLTVAYYVGMILVLAGILFQLNQIPYAFACLVAGLVPLFGVRLFNFLKGKPENKRLHGIMVVSALFLVAAAALIFMNRQYWIIAVVITATLDLYVSFRKFKG